MDWSDPEITADFLNSITASLIGGLLALSGVIGLFWLQQNAQRKEQRRRRLDDAARRLLEMSESVRASDPIDANWADKFHAMTIASWQFAWQLDRKDEPVVRWVMDTLLFDDPEREKPSNAHVAEKAKHSTALVVAMTGLNDWRLGRKRAKWYSEDLYRRKAARQATSR